ncbi:MAG: transposase [Actinomycetes bacterium]|jgi:transposase-like protein|nr:transposase [Actinomycetes bacterium]
MATYRQFTPEFKAQAIELAIEQDNAANTARELGIGISTLSKWVKVYKKGVRHRQSRSARQTRCAYFLATSRSAL